MELSLTNPLLPLTICLGQEWQEGLQKSGEVAKERRRVTSSSYEAFQDDPVLDSPTQKLFYCIQSFNGVPSPIPYGKKDDHYKRPQNEWVDKHKIVI